MQIFKKSTTNMLSLSNQNKKRVFDVQIRVSEGTDLNLKFKKLCTKSSEVQINIVIQPFM